MREGEYTREGEKEGEKVGVCASGKDGEQLEIVGENCREMVK